MSAFIITGLPRSRTAWMAAFYTTHNSLCYHEPSRFSGFPGVEELLRRREPAFVGASDYALTWMLPRLLDRVWPKVLVIERRPADVAASMMKITGKPCAIKLELDPGLRSHPLVLCVPYEALSDEFEQRRIWEHLLPGEPFNHERYRILSELNIQTMKVRKGEQNA